MWKKVLLLWRKTNRWHRVIVVFLLVESRLLPGGQVGFRCNDPALSHPFTGDTVNWKWLIAVCLLLPLVVMLFVERFQEKTDGGKDRALFWYKEYFFGALLNLTLVQSLKLCVGSPRPHFFDTCKPKEASACVGSEYVSSYTCTKAHWLNQSDKSFPSGHTSLALHAAIFVAWYLRARCARSGAAQAGGAAAAVACALSRLSDRRHHWWDVLAGALIAVALALYTILKLCKKFECSYPPKGACASTDQQLDNKTERIDNQSVTT